MKPLSRPSLAQLFVFATAAASLAVGITFYAVLQSTRRSIVRRSEMLRAEAALRIGGRLSSELGAAASVLDEVASAIRFDALRVDDAAAVESRLFSELLSHPTISDVAVTHAVLMGRQSAWGPADRWQISVFRASPDPESAIMTRSISEVDGVFVSDVRRRARGGSLWNGVFERESLAVDPTSHPTFETTVSPSLYGKAIWSDLSYSELDAALPRSARRVVVTLQNAVEDASGRFAGVVRVGLLTQTIDALSSADTGDPAQRVFLCDRQGRLVARSDPSDHLELMGDDLRFVSARPQPELSTALDRLRQRELANDEVERSERIVVAGVPFLVTYRALDNSQEWVAGILVPEDHYTRDLRALRDRFLAAIVVVTAIVLLIGGFVVQRLRRSLGRVIETMARMRGFDFSPSEVDAPLREMVEVMEGVERAKTSVRALGKYVPMDLVRELYEANREPALGGELRELSLMFSDIEGFTSLSERLPPAALAQALGYYLEAMTAGVRSTRGTVDKFIGDSVMAFWNAPTACPDHPQRACASVLACLRNTRELYASSAWTGLPPLATRFGLHRARVMVGHFGALERFSYTALGDGVNLASRLEGLCKQYGVFALASETVVEQVRDVFAFRLIDRVAVKGKHASVRVYELLGALGDDSAVQESARVYEQGLEAYFARDFGAALALFASRAGDPPSLVLAERCRKLLASPPSDDWDGVYVATTK
jgi:adenylate cyclase